MIRAPLTANEIPMKNQIEIMLRTSVFRTRLSTVAPASLRLRSGQALLAVPRGRLALGSAGGTPAGQPPGRRRYPIPSRLPENNVQHKEHDHHHASPEKRLLVQGYVPD